MVSAMILAPIAYILIIVGSMATFSSLYRKRQAIQAASMEPWFKPSPARDMYLTLLHLPDTGAKVPDSVLRAALIQRAVSMIHRAIAVKNAKGPLQQLLQRGSVGDDTWTQFQQCEQQLDKELREIIEEANSLSPGGNWGQTIFQSAAEMAHNERFKNKVDQISEKSAELSKWWEAKAAKVRAEFLKSEGIEDDAKPRPVTPAKSEKAVSEAAGSPLATPHQSIPSTVITPAAPGTSPAEKNGGSDEDVVVVDSQASGAPGSPVPSSPAMSTSARTGSVSGASADGGSMRKKKKKGKK